MLERISENLSEAMQNKVAFRIPIFGGIPVPVSCVVTWIIMAILVIASILLTRNLKLIPDRKQMMLESFVGFLRDFFREQLGEKGMAYFPFLATVIIYIGFANIIGLLGFTPPTKDLNVTAGLAIMSIVLVEVAGIRAKGTKGWLKSFAKPVAIIAPLNVMELFDAVCPIVIPLAVSAYFDIFDGFIQAYVFVFLTSLFINEAIEDDD